MAMLTAGVSMPFYNNYQPPVRGMGASPTANGVPSNHAAAQTLPLANGSTGASVDTGSGVGMGVGGGIGAGSTGVSVGAGSSGASSSVGMGVGGGIGAGSTGADNIDILANSATGKRVEAEEKKDNKAVNGRCNTCDSRKYQDGSNDPGVSFKSPTNIRPEAAATAVMAHEQEHVTRERQKAGQENRELISQSVTLHLGICPECHRSYVAGGTTRTTTASAKAQYSANMASAASSGTQKLAVKV